MNTTIKNRHKQTSQLWKLQPKHLKIDPKLYKASTTKTSSKQPSFILENLISKPPKDMPKIITKQHLQAVVVTINYEEKTEAEIYL